MPRDFRPEAFWNHALDTLENGMNLLDQLAESGTEISEDADRRLSALLARLKSLDESQPRPVQ